MQPNNRPWHYAPKLPATAETPECPYCNTSFVPELTGQMRGFDVLKQASYVVESYLCPVCSRTFRVRR